jgi:transcriptional regulator with XRE-family HTH domain
VAHQPVMNNHANLSDVAEPTRTAQAVAIGSRLRAVRHQIGLSLPAVAAMSNREFTATTLGSYERGDRGITVPRLHRLAKFYDVPIDQLLPSEDAGPGWSEAEDTERSPSPSHRTQVGQQKVSIDLARLRAGGGPEHLVLQRFVGMIEVQRQNFNGRMITLRSGDLRAVACLLGVTVDAIGHRLDDLGLMVVS